MLLQQSLEISGVTQRKNELKKDKVRIITEWVD